MYKRQIRDESGASPLDMVNQRPETVDSLEKPLVSFLNVAQGEELIMNFSMLQFLCMRGVFRRLAKSERVGRELPPRILIEVNAHNF